MIGLKDIALLFVISFTFGLVVGIVLPLDGGKVVPIHEDKTLQSQIDSLSKELNFWMEHDSVLMVSIDSLKKENQNAKDKLRNHRNDSPRVNDFIHVDLHGLDSLWTNLDTANR